MQPSSQNFRDTSLDAASRDAFKQQIQLIKLNYNFEKNQRLNREVSARR